MSKGPLRTDYTPGEDCSLKGMRLALAEKIKDLQEEFDELDGYVGLVETMIKLKKKGDKEMQRILEEFGSSVKFLKRELLLLTVIKNNVKKKEVWFDGVKQRKSS